MRQSTCLYTVAAVPSFPGPRGGAPRRALKQTGSWSLLGPLPSVSLHVPSEKLEVSFTLTLFLRLITGLGEHARVDGEEAPAPAREGLVSV